MAPVPIDLDIDMLRCFVEVAETGSFTRAGKNIGLSQSGVSVKIRRLEERIDHAVFQRSSKSLTLTHEGELLLDYARRVLEVHDEAVTRLLQPAAAGTLRVGLVDYFLPELLPNILNRFRKRYPAINLEIQLDVGINLMPQYEKGELDLIVAGRDAYQGASRILYREPLVWVLGQDVEFAPGDTLPLALLPPPCHFRQVATESLAQAQWSWDMSFTGTSIAGVQAAVQAGIGLSILPRGALRSGLRKAPAALGLPELPEFELALFMDDQREDEARDVFVEYLEAELEGL